LRAGASDRTVANGVGEEVVIFVGEEVEVGVAVFKAAVLVGVRVKDGVDELVGVEVFNDVNVAVGDWVMLGEGVEVLVDVEVFKGVEVVVGVRVKVMVFAAGNLGEEGGVITGEQPKPFRDKQVKARQLKARNNTG